MRRGTLISVDRPPFPFCLSSCHTDDVGPHTHDEETMLLLDHDTCFPNESITGSRAGSSCTPLTACILSISFPHPLHTLYTSRPLSSSDRVSSPIVHFMQHTLILHKTSLYRFKGRKGSRFRVGAPVELCPCCCPPVLEAIFPKYWMTMASV